MIAGKIKIPMIYIYSVTTASAHQVVAFGLLSSAPITHISPTQYGYQVLAGF
jgi:hypothetical protein